MLFITDSRAALDFFLATPNSTFLTPTASMAQRVRNELARASVPIRPSRILTLAKFQERFGPIAPGPIVIDGFLTFTPAELRFIENLAAQTSVTATLPDPQACPVPVTVFSAPTLDQEVEQIALRILEHHARGLAFQEMGILLQTRDPYVPALQSTLARFGIPASFHFAGMLSAHPAVQYITGIIRSLLTGWDHADLLTLLRMPVNGLGATPAGDRLDFAMRENLPATGLPALERIVGAANIGSSLLRPLLEIDPWKRDRLTPVDWAARLKTLRILIPPAQQLQSWRSIVAAIAAFDAILDGAALALDDDINIPLAAFWPTVEAALKTEKLRVPDRRRNVVNVLDVLEASQWTFRIAFVPGLTERPATTRATEETILSYPRFNDKGDAILRSSFLQEGEPCNPTRILPKPVGPGHALPDQPPPPPLEIQHAKLSPTSIESFLQCPFQFFAGKTLKLRPRPLKPRDRLNVLLQGGILHQAIAAGSFDPVFEQACRKNNIPRGYRTEAVRLELLRHFEALQADRQWPLHWPSRTEQQFLIPLTPALSIAGRIDRLDTGPDNQAIVIDYKYSPAAKVHDRVKVQGGLYLLAAQRFFHLKPAGMFYCALRQPISWEGWHAPVPGLHLGESRTALLELMAEAEQQAIETFASIVSGNKEVHPADPAKCRYCDYKNICRIESISHVFSGRP